MADCTHESTTDQSDGDYRVTVCANPSCGRELARTLKGPDLED